MHCDRCNVDFPEGLRYCKWCGEALVDRPRVTSELHSCPSCSAAIQPGWTFCKACGERLQGAASRPAGAVCPACGAENEAGAPKCLRCGEDLTGARAGNVAPDSADTAVITACSSCGERLDTGSLYCKGCGSAVYTEQTPFGGSALLCGACNSYSPLGSRVCRVCGAALAQGSRAVVDFPAGLNTVQQKAPTLPDLDDQIAGRAPLAKPEQEASAKTLIFTGVEQQAGPSIPRGTVETNMLPGTAGARSEQQAPTQVMQMGRITGPVDAEEAQEAPKPSGELTSSSAQGINAEPPSIKDQRVVAAEPTVEFAAVSQPPAAPGPTTLGLGSESESESERAPAGSENKTAVFVSRPQEAPPASREQVSRDDIGTRPVTPLQPSPEIEPTREFQQPAGWMTGDHFALPSQMTSAPQSTSAEAIAPTAASERLQSEPFSQVASQPPPKKRTGMVIASVVVALILLGAAGYVAWLLFGRGKPAPPTPPPVAVEPPPVTPAPVVPDKPPAPVVPQGMVAITAGTYTIGRDGADPLEQPEHRVDLPAFFIDRAEVTNAAYKMFVDATGHKPPSNWTGTSFPDGRGDFPVTGVTWQDAADYAAWAGKRLPTEVEWEAAARGTDGRIYPWGNGYRSGVANIGSKPDKSTPEQYPAGIKEIGRYPEGASPAGAVDMIGNAWEWVADEIKAYPGNTEGKLDLEPGVTHRVIRGGAYDGSMVHDATYRGYQDGSLPYPKVGFRCAKDAK
jgi:formylglycine-generating enzyme required for sulfatase activity